MKNKPASPYLGLSARLLLLTIVFVMVAEVLIYVPSIAYFRRTWLEERLAAAQIAALALVATSDFMVSDELSRELLENAMVSAVVLKREDNRKLILGNDMPLDITARYDLRDAGYWSLIRDAFKTMQRRDDGLIEVTGKAHRNSGDYVQIILKEMPLCRAMYDHTRNILLLSLVISLITAGLVYLALSWLMVRPVRRMTASIASFREAPEDATRIMMPEHRSDEIGIIQRELCEMQEAVRTTLRQNTRLANLGAAVAKINHDLRNILTSAHLVSDRLGAINDPKVQALAPRLIRAIDRAVNLCQQTLEYGKANESLPQKEAVNIKKLVDEVAASLDLDRVAPDRTAEDISVKLLNEVTAGLTVYADPDHVYRVLLNLVRNALQAIKAETTQPDRGVIRISTTRKSDQTLITVSDNGPGLPQTARNHLFEPFHGSGRADGTGLGLAISKELLEANGGGINLLSSTEKGTIFQLYLPTGQT